MKVSNSRSYSLYKQLLLLDCPRELARTVLPLATYTRMFATVNLHNLLAFIAARSHESAQPEIRCYADALLALITPIVPVTVNAWRTHNGH